MFVYLKISQQRTSGKVDMASLEDALNSVSLKDEKESSSSNASDETDTTESSEEGL